MQRRHTVDLNVEALHVLDEVGGEREGRGRCGVRRGGIVRVGLDENSLRRQVRHQHRRRMRVVANVIEYHGARALLEGALVAHTDDFRRLWRAGERVRLECVRSARDVPVERNVAVMCDDREPFRYCRADAARMIVVMVGVHRVPHWLVRAQLPSLGDDGEGPRLGLRDLDQHEVLFELHQHAVM